MKILCRSRITAATVGPKYGWSRETIEDFYDVCEGQLYQLWQNDYERDEVVDSLVEHVRTALEFDQDGDQRYTEQLRSAALAHDPKLIQNIKQYAHYHIDEYEWYGE